MFDYQVRFRAVAVPIEGQPAGFALVDPMFGDLRDDPAFEDGAAQGMDAKLVGGANPEQPADQTGIVEMELGHLYEPFAQIAVKRR